MKKLFLIYTFLMIVVLTNAQQALSLGDAIATALENNYSIQIVKQDQQIAEIRNNWGNAGRYPYISASLGSDNASNLNESEDYVRNSISAGVSLNWTLFDGYAVRISKQRFEELENLSKQNTAIMVEGTIQSVILAYYSALLEKEKLATVNEVMKLSEGRFEKEKHKKEFGTSVTYDVLQAQNSYLSDQSAYLLQEVAYKNALRDLNYLMAVNGNLSYELTEDFSAIPVEYVLSDLQAQMFENNKALQNQYINQRLLENAVASAKSDFMPSLTFNGGTSLSNARTKYEVNGGDWKSASNFYGNFTLSINLFSGGNRKRALQIAKIEEQVGLVEVDDMKHDLSNSLANLYEFYLVRQALLNLAEENLTAAKLNLQISQEKFEAGAINSFNFRDVQNLYLNAAQGRLTAIYNFIDTQTALLRTVGTIIQEYE